MFTVNHRVIGAKPLEVMNRLRSELISRGIDLCRDIKESGDNIQFTCPYHKDGKERKPSCGVSVIAKGKYPAGTVHCFTCGATTSIDQMISHCFGYPNDEGSFGKKWLIRNFITFDDGQERKVDIEFGRGEEKEAKPTFPEDLTKFRFYHSYMYKRKMTDEIIEKFDLGYDAETQCITFPCYDLNNNLVFVARRSVNVKYFHYPKNASKPVYGLSHIDLEHTEELIICESIFNALTCWVYGKKAVALLGLGTQEQYNILKSIPIRKYILAFDGDDAGRGARDRFKKMVANKLITYYDLPEGKDINDLSLAEFENLEEHFN